MLQRVLELLEHAVSVIEEQLMEGCVHGCLASGFVDSVTVSALDSVRILACSPFFSSWREKHAIQDELPLIIQVIERLLLGLATLFEEFSKWVTNLESKSGNCSLTSDPVSGDNARIMDMELDMEDKPKDQDTSAASGKSISGISSSFLQMKLDMLSTISCFFAVLPDITWGIMFDLMRKENDSRVNSMNSTMEVSGTLKLCCAKIVTAIRNLLGALQPSGSSEKDENFGQSGREKLAGQNLVQLGDLVNRVAEVGLIEWSARVELIDCICSFVMLNPCIGQVIFIDPTQ
ncbi:hypothetical protein ACLOJK_001956 [Asimina triloba]